MVIKDFLWKALHMASIYNAWDQKTDEHNAELLQCYHPLAEAKCWYEWKKICLFLMGSGITLKDVMYVAFQIDYRNVNKNTD